MISIALVNHIICKVFRFGIENFPLSERFLYGVKLRFHMINFKKFPPFSPIHCYSSPLLMLCKSIWFLLALIGALVVRVCVTICVNLRLIESEVQ